MPVEVLAGLNVTDETSYHAYRDGIKAILEQYGAHFTHDFKVAETVVNTSDAPINRIMTLRYPDMDALNTMSQDEAYLSVRGQYFDKGVKDTTIIAMYDVE
ncbi:MAG: DUF1330 domain-containing protein [Deinococcota bacterium]|jgi:uncharacterized protein (DUF1330 family)